MQNAAPCAQYDWLAMLFLGGDNDLFQFGQDLITEAQRVGSSNRVAVVAEHDPTDPAAPTYRGQLFPGRWDKENIGRTGGDPEAIVDFIQYAKQKFPAQKRMLVLWDHGNGWQNVHVFEPLIDATVRLRLQDILRVVDEQQGVSVLCFDSCLMAMIEIAYQLRDRVEYIVASENVVPADSGWPYDAILRTLTMRPHITPQEIACAIVDGFSGSYNGSDQPVTLSALRVSGVVAAVAAVDNLSRELIAACVNGERDKILLARRYTQAFGNPDYIDLASFCDELQRQPFATNDIHEATVQLKTELDTFVIGCTRGSALSISGAQGVSIYYPDRPLSPMYQNLDFAKTKNCLWATFLGMVTTAVAPPENFENPGKTDKEHADDCRGGAECRCEEHGETLSASSGPDSGTPVNATQVNSTRAGRFKRKWRRSA
jgi:hypothetical protein